LLSRLRFEYTRQTTLWAERLRNSFYLYLAALLSLAVLLDASVFHVGENMKQKAFDFVVRHRVIAPKPDPDIVIVDVNEASLAALAPDYGRWPWPRQVFGEFVEHLQDQHPKAIVFDILFSDADLYNPDSDTYFNDVIADADNTYFPFLRLSETQDKLSKVMPHMIPGAQRIGNTGVAEESVAVVLPHFKAALQAGRLGTHNIYPDADGIAREYRMWQDKGDWRLPSLPMLVGTATGGEPPAHDSLLLNWRGGPFTYHFVSFSDVYRDMSASKRKRPANEFRDKIVIIGSTAPSLFDLKATAMAKMHPGVEILATAIDNVKHGDDLRFWRGALPYVLMSLLVIWLTASAFYRNIERERFDKLFGLSQFLLLAISYIGMNLSNLYIDLTAPVTWAIAYFSIAKFYALATDRVMQRMLVSTTAANGTGYPVTLMPLLLESPHPLGDAALKHIRRAVEIQPGLARNVEVLKGTQSGVWGLFADMLVVTWVSGNDDDIRQDAERLIENMPSILKKQGIPATMTLRHTLHHGILDGSQDAARQWRTLFAQAVLKLDHQGNQS
jgi:adenylate cyclase